MRGHRGWRRFAVLAAVLSHRMVPEPKNAFERTAMESERREGRGP